MNNLNKLPDGSGFFLADMPLPKDHWLYKPNANEWDNERDCSKDQPKPILTHEFKEQVAEAARFAIRGATMNGTVTDFDPDAMVQNMVVALCGPRELKATINKRINSDDFKNIEATVVKE